MKTKTGFEFTLKENAADDMFLLFAIEDMNAAVSSEDNMRAMSAMRKVCRILLGGDGEQRICEHIKQTDGRAPVSAFSAEVGDIIAALGEAGKK